MDKIIGASACTILSEINMERDDRLMNPANWAKQVPIVGNAYTILQLLGEESDLYGKGKKSIASLITKSELDPDKIARAINSINSKKIASIEYTQNSNFITFQLSLHIFPTTFKFLND